MHDACTSQWRKEGPSTRGDASISLVQGNSMLSRSRALVSAPRVEKGGGRGGGG